MAKTSFSPAGAVLALVCALAAPAHSAQPKEPVRDLDLKAFFVPELYISSSHADLEKSLARLPNREAWESFLGGAREGFANPARMKVWIDPRSGTVTNIMGAYPLIPGNGVGNKLTADSLRLGALRAEKVDARVVEAAVRGFIEKHAALLGIDVAQLGPARVTQVNPDLWQVYIPQVYEGLPVRHGHLVASISHGNLVTIGTDTWGNVSGLAPRPEIPAEAALHTGFAFADGPTAEDLLLQPAQLEVVPVAPELQAADGAAAAAPSGYRHRLVWSFVFQRPPDDARWEVLVDARTGELLALQDINHYVQRQVTGGVYPVTSTEICPNDQKCGIMQSGWPMPFANTGLAAPNNFTNSAGVFDWTSGNATTTLSGQYVRISDACGAISATGAGDVPMGGANGQHDCTTPGSGGAGNTAASRSGFYELNKLVEMARGYLPGNTWLQAQLTANVNINNTCNAFWNGSTINFYRSGGGCRNTGELAGVFDHEWGHGIDDNDANGVISNSGEGYADIAAIYRYQDSCVGHGFFMPPAGSCGLTADGTGANVDEDQTAGIHCATDCSGVRDADYGKHSDGVPDTALGHVCTRCNTGTGPCGRQVHCAAAPQRQAAWDLVARDLPAAGYDSQSAFIVGNKLFYQGSGNIGTWYSCTCGSSSSACGSTNGYIQWITADDDNGNLNDGTPHMTAIHAAFNRHGIACATPTPTNSGCAGGPSTAPTLTATAGNYQVALSWTSATGATRYWVYRTEGHAGCNYGKALIAEVTGTSYTDTKVANGRTYYYNVVAAGSSSACYSRASSCVSATPVAGPPTPDFSVSCSPSSVSVAQGASSSTTCTVTSTGGFSSAVTLSCANLPSGVTCSHSPNPVTPPANGSVNSTTTFTASGTAAVGTSTVTVNGTSGASTRSANVTLTVTGTGGPVTVFYDGAESPTTTFVRTNTTTSTQWTRNSTSPFAGSWRWKAGGSTGGNYGNNGDARMTTPTLSLGGAATATLTYAFKHSTELNFDFFQVRISTDGGTNWTNLVNVSGNSAGWSAWAPLKTINLNAYAGQTNVKIQFRLTTDGSVTAFGAAVDEVKVVKQ